jgi:hypothetical protein
MGETLTGGSAKASGAEPYLATAMGGAGHRLGLSDGLLSR